MDDTLSIAHIYTIFSQKSDLVYRFVSLQNEYYAIPRDYGTGAFLTMVESTTLKSIEGSPGITVTELAHAGRRTKGAVSQVVKKLEQRGYVFRKRCPADGKRALLHVTDKGKRLNSKYRTCDMRDMQIMLEKLLEDCTIAEADAFFKVLHAYTALLEEEVVKRGR